MKKRGILLLVIILLVIAGFSVKHLSANQPQAKSVNAIHFGNRKKEGFRVNDTLKNGNRTYHFSSYFPKGYNAQKTYDLYLALPGWEGLYFQGVGANLEERFPFEAIKYRKNLIVISPQLDDWGKQSAQDTIYLTQYMQKHYRIRHTYISGVSGGGETLSRVFSLKPQLYTRALHVISRFDGSLEPIAKRRLPLYIAIGAHDNYYGSVPAKQAASRLRQLYYKQGLTSKAISRLLVLDVKPDAYFKKVGYVNNQHGGGGALFPYDQKIMKWLFKN